MIDCKIISIYLCADTIIKNKRVIRDKVSYFICTFALVCLKFGSKAHKQFSEMNTIIEHDGIIERIESNRAFVRIEQRSACSACHAKAACTASDMAEKIIEAIISTNNSFSIGEEVTLVGERSMGLKAVLLAFVIPFSLILVSLFALKFVTTNEAIAGSIALGTLIPYFGILALLKTKLANKFRFYATKKK